MDAPSSKAMEEAEHFWRIVLREKSHGKGTLFLNSERSEEAYSDEKAEAANGREQHKSK